MCVTQALHWDRGRPARNEREARTERLHAHFIGSIAPASTTAGETPAVPVQSLTGGDSVSARCSLLTKHQGDDQYDE